MKEHKPWKYIVVFIIALAVAVTLHRYLSGWLCPARGCRARADFMVNFFLVWMPSFLLFLAVAGTLTMMLDKLHEPFAAPASEPEPTSATPASNRDQASAAYDRGVARLQSGECEATLREFNTAIGFDDRYVNAYVGRAHAYAELGQSDRALADYSLAIQLDPQSDVAFRSRGRVWHEMGDPRRAVADYDEALRIRPDYLQAFYGRGLAYRDLGETRQAIADLRQALALGPDDATRSSLQTRLAELGAQS